MLGDAYHIFTTAFPKLELCYVLTSALISFSYGRPYVVMDRPIGFTPVIIDHLLLFIMRLEDRLQPSIADSLRPVLMVFTRSSITPQKGNRFGQNLGHSEYVVWDWPWQILGAICAQ